jgi:hypothetical protein
MMAEQDDAWAGLISGNPAERYPEEQYPAQQQYPAAERYPTEQYPAERYPAERYPAEPYPADQPTRRRPMPRPDARPRPQDRPPVAPQPPVAPPAARYPAGQQQPVQYARAQQHQLDQRRPDQHRPDQRRPEPAQRTSDGRATWTLGIDTGRIERVLWLTLSALVVLDFLASAAVAEGAPFELTRFFDADEKVNFPTGFKTSMLLSVTLLLFAHWAIAVRRRDPFAPAWRLLAYVTCFAFVDETVYLHQSLASMLHSHLHTGGPLLYAWTVLYVPMAAAVAVIVLRYLPFLERELMWRLVAGGAMYVLGTLALEPIKSELAESKGEGGLAFKLTAAVSDSMEMTGLTILVVILLAELARRTEVVGLLLRRPDPRRNPGRR